MFASVLVVEETTDRLQRSMLDDDDIQPFIRMINRIHVVEEARHVRYARNTPICNLYLEMMERMDVQATSFGDSTGRLPNLT